MNKSISAATLDYASRDYEIVDYKFYELPGTPGVKFRGPAFDLVSTRDYFTCIGAAQTLGIYVERPYSELLAKKLEIPALNLAIGAVWPGFYSDVHPELIDIVNRGRFLILQVMSARGESSSRFEATEIIEMMRDRKTGEVLSSIGAWKKILVEDHAYAVQYVEELRSSWVRSNLALLEAVKVPVILFWYSRRQQDEPVNYSSEGDVFKNLGEFPQFVDSKSVKAVASACDGFAECYSCRNTGHPLISRFTGQPVAINNEAMRKDRALSKDNRVTLDAATNNYYPSPEMHEDAASVLFEQLQANSLIRRISE